MELKDKHNNNKQAAGDTILKGVMTLFLAPLLVLAGIIAIPFALGRALKKALQKPSLALLVEKLQKREAERCMEAFRRIPQELSTVEELQRALEVRKEHSTLIPHAAAEDLHDKMDKLLKKINIDKPAVAATFQEIVALLRHLLATPT